MNTLLALLAKVPPELVSALVKVVQAIMGSSDPLAAAERAAEEAARVQAVDEFLKREKP